METVPNLDFLSEEEKRKILSVIKRDESVRMKQDSKIGQIRQEIQTLRQKSILKAGDDLTKMCARCHERFGLLFNRGDICPKCRFRVCKLCQEIVFNGGMLCVLCYKQRQLKLLLTQSNQGRLGRRASGSDLIKASMKLTLVSNGADVNSDSSPTRPVSDISPTRTVSHTHKDGSTSHNGSAFNDRHHNKAENERFPKTSDRRKLTELFDTFKPPGKGAEGREDHEKSVVKRVSSKRYDSDSDSSTSASDDEMPSAPVMSSTVLSSPSLLTEREITSSTKVTHSQSENDVGSRKHDSSNNIQSGKYRKHSNDSDHSDEEPFSKSSTETQIKVEIHSDSNSERDVNIPISPVHRSDNVKKTPTEIIMAKKVSRKDSSSSQRSTSPEVYDNAHLPLFRQQHRPANGSSSPYSFDSLPSSHANSPLPKHRLVDIASDNPSYRDSSDTDSLSRQSGTEYSGTESSLVQNPSQASSENDDYTVEELSKVRFRRMSRSSLMSSPNPRRGVPPKLSPRSGSEGSGSLEDSGHVSGTSTQENTPEHHRTDSLQSQLSVPSTLSTVTDDSRESIVSYYSNAGEVDYGKIPVTGEIQFGLDYNYRTGTLEIYIKQCKDLAPVDTKRNRSDPYVKTYLLPDKTRSGKRKTKVKKHTLSPTFEETLRYLISKSELENRTLWVTVWHSDKFGRNDFLGEVTINFDYFRFSDSAPKWYSLQERFESPSGPMLSYKGDLIISLRYVPHDTLMGTKKTSPMKKKLKKTSRMESGPAGELHVVIKEARNLTAVRSNGTSDPFCKGYLLPDKHRSSKQKTPIVKQNCNPMWNHTFIFEEVTISDLKERSLELTLWDFDKISSNDFLGGVRLNLGVGRSCGKQVDWMDARGEEISMWQAMLDRPNMWIDGSLILRSNMDKRKY